MAKEKGEDRYTPGYTILGQNEGERMRNGALSNGYIGRKKRATEAVRFFRGRCAKKYIENGALL